jgi:hypothetical protein
MPNHLSFARLAAAALLAGAACAPTPTADPAPQPETGAFVVTLGVDTIALERFTRTAERIAGELVVLTPQVLTRDYMAELRPDGSVSRLRVTTRSPAAAAALPQVITTEYGPEAATVRTERGDTVGTAEVPTPDGAFPWLMHGYGLTEQAIRHGLPADGERTAVLPHLFVGGGPQRVTLTRVAPDSVVIETFIGRSHARLDAEGRIVRLRSPESTQQVEVERVETLDLGALTAAAVRRELAGTGLGVLSPRDSVAARLGDATVSVAYGRPSARGRTIFGQVVPWGQVWRTGANAATHLYTDRDLEIGGTLIPAGTYSLFTIPSPASWVLIVNRQTGQWGTAHDPARDVARIPMQRRTLPERVETFTISFEDLANGRGRLVLAWDDTEASVPVRAR